MSLSTDMAELVFYYGAMGCSKTANALMTRFQHLEKNRKVWLIKPATDTRDDIITADGKIKTMVTSRIGLSAEAEVVHIGERINPPLTTNVIICDEAQFLTPEQVEDLKKISEQRNMSVYCYGLRTDFQSKLFPGSKRLFELASRIEELDTICECGNKAIISARLIDGHVVTEGPTVQIGGDESYRAMCYNCWKRYQ
jgi:thymidine kinase